MFCYLFLYYAIFSLSKRHFPLGIIEVKGDNTHSQRLATFPKISHISACEVHPQTKLVWFLLIWYSVAHHAVTSVFLWASSAVHVNKFQFVYSATSAYQTIKYSITVVSVLLEELQSICVSYGDCTLCRWLSCSHTVLSS